MEGFTFDYGPHVFLALACPVGKRPAAAMTPALNSRERFSRLVSSLRLPEVVTCLKNLPKMILQAVSHLFGDPPKMIKMMIM